MQKLFRFLSFGLLLLVTGILAVFFLWFKPNYPAYAKDFLVLNSVKPASEIFVAKLSLESWEQEESPKIEHYKIRFNQSDPWAFDPKEIIGLGTSNTLVLSLETWGSKYWPCYRSNPLDWIPVSSYDEKLTSLLLGLKQHKGEIYLRLNPEMEVPGRV
jgi:hypothetical protein